MNVMEQTLRETIDPALTRENLSLLATRAMGRPLQAVSARVLTGGCWNRVISVGFEGRGPELVFKINPQKGDERIEREYRVLKYFAAHTEMPVPDPYLLDTSGSVIPGSLLIMKKLSGWVLHQAYGILDSGSSASVSEQIGHFVGRLHTARSKGFGGAELAEERRETAWSDFWLPRFDRVFEDSAEKGLVSAAFLEEVASARRDFPRLLAIGEQSTLTHYDIWSGNIMIDKEDGSPTVSGFLDVPGFWADYARELSFMEMFGVADSRFYQIYRSYHALDEAFEIRKNVYNLKMHMKHIMMYPDQSFYRNGAQQCLRQILRNR